MCGNMRRGRSKELSTEGKSGLGLKTSDVEQEGTKALEITQLAEDKYRTA